MSEYHRKPDVPTFMCPAHPDTEMRHYGESKYMDVWFCTRCKALPRKKRKLYSGVVVVHKQAGLRVPTPEQRLDYLARRERDRMERERETAVRAEEADRLARGLPTRDEERFAEEQRRAL